MFLLPLRALLIPRLPFTSEELSILDAPTASPFVSSSLLLLLLAICTWTLNGLCGSCENALILSVSDIFILDHGIGRRLLVEAGRWNTRYQQEH